MCILADSRQHLGADMRIASSFVLASAFFGVGVSDGWCPEPANLGGSLSSSSGATGAAIYNPTKPKYDEGQNPYDPKNMTQSQRMMLIGREKQAGRLKTEQEVRNFLQTGDSRLSYTPPPPKTVVKPKSMSDAQWQKFEATRPKPLEVVRGTYTGSGSGKTMEQNAARNGGKLTPIAPPALPKPVR